MQELEQNLSEIAVNYPQQVHVRTTISKVNIDDLENILDRLVGMHVRRVEIGPLVDYHNDGVALDGFDEDRVISMIKRFERTFYKKMPQFCEGCSYYEKY